MAYVYEACTVRVTIFSTGGIIPAGFKFYGVTHSYSSRPFLCALAITEKGIENISIGTRNCCSFEIVVLLLAKISFPAVQQMTGLRHYTHTYCTAVGYGDGLWTLCLYSTERDFVNTSWSHPLLR